MEGGINKVEELWQMWGFKLSLGKTTVMPFANGNLSECDLKLHIGNFMERCEFLVLCRNMGNVTNCAKVTVMVRCVAGSECLSACPL